MDEEKELTPEEQVKELERFIYNNHDLEELESIADKFNIFLSLGIINQELRHSNFLAWILDPMETHNLGDYFIKSFLKQVSSNDPDPLPDIDIFKIDAYDYSDVQVLREWNKIDILLIDEVNKFLCVIENKVDSGEHSDQLSTYRSVVESHYPNYKKIFVYLTVNGEKPENDNYYIPISYGEVSELISELMERKSSQLSEEVNIFIKHYNEMIKRYIVEESDVREICEQLYKNHRKALNLIFKYKPDVYSVVKEILAKIVENNDELILDHSIKSYTRFLPKSFDFIPLKGDGWTPSKRILLFEISYTEKAYRLYLTIGPGDDSIRQIIYDKVKPLKEFNKNSNQISKQWSSIFTMEFIKLNKLENLTKEEIRELITEKMDKFMKVDLPKLKKPIEELEDLIVPNN
ncbi:MAG: nuclease [Bacteroidetes bacterium]|nr:MAG: nuclease [Bacteroidota bacterium]